MSLKECYLAFAVFAYISSMLIVLVDVFHCKKLNKKQLISFFGFFISDYMAYVAITTHPDNIYSVIIGLFFLLPFIFYSFDASFKYMQTIFAYSVASYIALSGFIDIEYNDYIVVYFTFYYILFMNVIYLTRIKTD
jgi:hypothetical protein